MKKHVMVLSLLCISSYHLSGEAAVYKCTIDGTVVYQDSPCEAGQTPMSFADVPVRVKDPEKPAPSVSKQEPQSTIEPNQLVVGMSDTKVLNLRGWGRPSKITRSKANQVWREEWIYVSSAGEQRHLQFSNGKLTDINANPVVSRAPPQQVSRAPQQISGPPQQVSGPPEQVSVAPEQVAQIQWELPRPIPNHNENESLGESEPTHPAQWKE